MLPRSKINRTLARLSEEGWVDEIQLEYDKYWGNIWMSSI